MSIIKNNFKFKNIWWKVDLYLSKFDFEHENSLNGVL